jgi:hypothetical protein
MLTRVKVKEFMALQQTSDFKSRAGEGYTPLAFSDEQIDRNANLISSTPRYGSATFSSIAAVFWSKITVEVDNAATFNGDAYGLVGVLGNGDQGSLFTYNYDNLISNTKSFMVTSLTVYVSVQWYDSGHNVIGFGQFGGFGVPGMGGGKNGTWS